MELSELQKQIIENSPDKTVVIAAAAAGKTQTLTEKVRQLLRSGVDPSKIAVITFTKMAAGVLRDRLGSDYNSGMFIGTIHALANYFLMSHGIYTGDLIEKEKFDDFFELLKEHPHAVEKMEWVILDEAQDSNAEQFEFLFDMIKPDHFFVVGDFRQTIYEWCGSDPQLLKELMNKEGVTTFSLNENYRNGFNILNFAKRKLRICGMDDDSRAMRKYNGIVTEANFSYDYILSQIRNDGDYKNWAVLGRSNQDVTEMMYFLKKNKIPCDTFRQGDLTKEELDEKMEADTVKILTLHSAKGLEWDKVVVLPFNTPVGRPEECRLAYVGATRARDRLIWTSVVPKRKRKKSWEEW